MKIAAPAVRARRVEPASPAAGAARSAGAARGLLPDAGARLRDRHAAGRRAVGGRAGRRARRRVAPRGGGALVVLRGARRRVRAGRRRLGSPPPALSLMRALKGRFDPDRRLAPGPASWAAL